MPASKTLVSDRSVILDFCLYQTQVILWEINIKLRETKINTNTVN